MLEEDLTYKIRGAIFAVYKELGPGLLELIYEAALVYELRKRGLCVEQQKELKVYYDGVILPIDYKIDLLVENKVIVELKSVSELKDVYFKQLLTYLRITNKRVGLLVNFNTNDITQSIKRVVL
ncbi:MAG: GxxExxY protein [Paludibacteraceae bacterium]|nr:GxxExxY protein [Paludibacteraceae bacterium]